MLGLLVWLSHRVHTQLDYAAAGAPPSFDDSLKASIDLASSVIAFRMTQSIKHSACA
jgi:hypothetical protein